MTTPQIILIAVLGLLLALIAVVLIRTLTFRPKKTAPVTIEKIDFDGDKAVESLRTLVRFPTVSYRPPMKENEAAFVGLLDALPGLFPHVFATCQVTRLPDRGLLLHWEGKSHDAPAVMMSHYDVVPALSEAWEKPPFEGVLENGVLWGRGTLDTKITLNSALFAADTLIAQGFVPEKDVYFAFSGCEEINGLGALHIVNWFKEKGITPALVLDEGGAVVENVFPGLKAACAMIGIAEKGMMDVRYSAKSRGGHASAPKPKTPIGVLSAACLHVLKKPFSMRVSDPVDRMFDTLGRHSNFFYRMIFANRWLFSPVLNMLSKKSGGDLNALLRTTVAFTQMQGSEASNVIPPEAHMVSNMRLNPGDTMASAQAHLKKAVKDDSVEITVLHGVDPSPISRVDAEGWHKISHAVAATWPEAIVTPYLMMQCSDSRHYAGLSDRVYRFSSLDMTKEERASIHGHNECVRVEAICRSVAFYLRLLKSC